MNLRILGCSGGIGAGHRTTSFLVEHDILIDAGSGVGELTLAEMGEIRHIFVTHSHLDHVNFIPLLIDTIFSLVKKPVIVHGQAVTLKALQEHIFNWVIWPDFSKLPTPERPVLAFREMVPGQVVDIEGRMIEMIPVNHAVPAVGYRVSKGKKSFAYSGDTSSNDSLWAALNAHDRLDMLIVETAFPNVKEHLAGLAGHYCPKTFAADIVKLKHDTKIYLTHLMPGEEDRILAELSALVPGRSLHRLASGAYFQL
ncbi:MAG: 3',5'-cyclic-nucleotide phosphodiesterase [Gammaproteobacteria bacterium]|nr:3',5'-cyclic-nucleotide phosphodiesterase [Gammaproteobacteria bacterium]